MASSLKQKHIQHIWNNARKHLQASKVGLPSDMQNYEVCECCDHAISKQPISMNQHTKEFQIFGFGYPLYFSYLKYCILLVLILVASKTGTSLYLATKENYDFCYGNGQSSEHSNGGQGHPNHFLGQKMGKTDHLTLRHFGENEISLKEEHRFQDTQVNIGSASQNHQLKQIAQAENHFAEGHPKPPHQQSAKSPHSSQKSQHQEHHAECTSFMVYFSVFIGEEEYNNYFLRILSFVVHLIALIGIRNMLLKQEQYYDERTCSLSDYSVMVSNLPPTYGAGAMVKKMFKEEFSKDSEVKELIYVFEDEKIEEFQEKMQKLEEKQLQAIEQNNEHQLQQIKKQIHQLEDEFHFQIKTLKGDIDRDYIKCDKVIVIMNTEKDKGDVLDKFEKGLLNKRDYTHYFQHISLKKGTKTHIKIKEAPQPNEIVWEHIDESDTARKGLVFKGWVFTILFLAVVTVCFYFIMLAKTNLFVHAVELEHHDPSNPKVHSSKMFATIIVFVAIFGVILFNKFIMGKVLHKFVHMEKHAYTDQEGHSFAMKYSLGMFFTTALMTLAVEAITFKNFYSHQYGVIEEETIMFFVTAFFIPLVWLIHPYNLAKKIEFKLNENTLVTQEKANELIEDFPYDLGKRYAEIFEIMWFTFLYCELIPLGSFLILIGLVLYYWVDKYNFLRRSALKEGLSGKISILSLKSLDATLFLAPAGRVLFNFILHQQIDILGIIMTVIGLIYLFLPISELIWEFNEEKFLIQDKTYEQAKYSFKQHYYTLHPVYRLTHKKENQNYRKKVLEYYKNDMQNAKMYGAGRGTFLSDERPEGHGSKINGANSTNASKVYQ